MIIEELDLNTRNKIYNSTKKFIRKYQKGISSGKLTAEKFAENIYANRILSNILDESILNQADFQNSYLNYINTLMKNQNENFKSYLNRLKISKACKAIEEDPEIKISALSLQLGFTSANTFIRVFSKYVGITPKLYAEKIIKDSK